MMKGNGAPPYGHHHHHHHHHHASMPRSQAGPEGGRGRNSPQFKTQGGGGGLVSGHSECRRSAWDRHGPKDQNNLNGIFGIRGGGGGGGRGGGGRADEEGGIFGYGFGGRSQGSQGAWRGARWRPRLLCISAGQGGGGGYNARRSGAPGPHAHGNVGRQVVDYRRAEVRGQRKPSNDPRNQHSPGTPTTGIRKRRNDTSRSTGRRSQQNAATRRST